MKKLLDEAKRGSGGGGVGAGYSGGGAGAGYSGGHPTRTDGQQTNQKPLVVIDLNLYNKSLMMYFHKLCLGQSPKMPQDLKDLHTGQIIPWVSPWMDKSLVNIIPDQMRRNQLLTLLGPAGCTMCNTVFREHGSGKLLFPHIIFNQSNPKLSGNQAEPNSWPSWCPMMYSCNLKARVRLVSKSLVCKVCLRAQRGCRCQNTGKKTSDICPVPTCRKHYLVCEHKESVEMVERWKSNYIEKYDALVKSTFAASTTAPVLGQTDNLMTFLLALEANRGLPEHENNISMDELHEMYEIHSIPSQTVQKQTMKDILKNSTVKKANLNQGLLTSFLVAGNNDEPAMVISDSGCTSTVLDKTVSEHDILPVV